MLEGKTGVGNCMDLKQTPEAVNQSEPDPAAAPVHTYFGLKTPLAYTVGK